MKKSLKYILGAVLVSCPAVALSQNLSTEVVVDRTIVPEEKAAMRPGALSPVLVMPPATAPELHPELYTTLSTITRSYARLDPASGSIAATPSPYRGYAALGYFPLIHGGATAGYRVISKPSLVLDAAIQAEASRNKPKKRDPRDYMFYNVRAGVNGMWTPDSRSTLSFKASYDFLNQESTMWEMQSVNFIQAAAGWSSSAGDISYDATISASFENPGNTIVHPEAFNPAKDVTFYQPRQQQFIAKVHGGYTFLAGSAANLALEFNSVHSSNCVYRPVGSRTRTAIAAGGDAGYVAVTPYYSLSSGRIHTTVGARLSLGVGNFSGKKFRVAPDINVQWDASDAVALRVRAEGGDQVLTNHDLRQYSPYQIFIFEARNSSVPIAVTAAVDITPYRGFTLSLGGGYAKADNWLMCSSTVPSFRGYDISGWNATVALQYRWKWLKAGASAMFSPGDYSHAWIYNRDRAKTVVDASVEIKPLSPLTVGVEYRGRMNRSCWNISGHSYSLGDISNINAYASWRLNSAITFFGRLENILGHRYLVLAEILSEKQTGAIGVEVKF